MDKYIVVSLISDGAEERIQGSDQFAQEAESFLSRFGYSRLQLGRGSAACEEKSPFSQQVEEFLNRFGYSIKDFQEGMNHADTAKR